MKKENRRVWTSFFAWLPVLFFGILIYKAPAIIIPQFHLYISSRISVFLYGALGILWILLNPLEQYFRPWFWDLIRNLLPIEFMCLFLYMQSELVYGILLILLILLTLTILVVIARCHRQQVIRYIRGETGYQYMGRRTVALVLCVILLFPTVCIIGEDHFMPAHHDVETEYVVQSFNTLMEKYQDHLAGFENENWNRSDKKQRVDTLQQLADFEMKFLNCPALRVISEDLGEHVEGKYVYPDHLIIVDEDFLMRADAVQAMKLICHESRHAYQRTVVNMLDWQDPEVVHHYYYRNAQRWKYDFDHYEDGQNDYQEYAGQSIEQDARAYAENSVEAFSQYLDLGQ